MSEVIYMTKEKVEQLEHQLHDLRFRGRKEIAQKIADARSHGDLSENADYDAAKHEQELMEIKIANLERTLSKVQVITANDFPSDKVYILSKVTVKNIKSGDKVQFMMVSPEEADFEENKISVTSPLGKALMGRKIGDMTSIRVPAGLVEYEILDIGK